MEIVSKTKSYVFSKQHDKSHPRIEIKFLVLRRIKKSM